LLPEWSFVDKVDVFFLQCINLVN